MYFKGYPIVIFRASTFLGNEFNVIGSRVSSDKIIAVFCNTGNFDNISPAYFI